MMLYNLIILTVPLRLYDYLLILRHSINYAVDYENTALWVT